MGVIRDKISKRQSTKYREAVRLMTASADRVESGKGSHLIFFIGDDRLVLSIPKTDQLMHYQLKQIDQWLTRNGK